MVGLFWILDDGGHARILALAVRLDQAIAYGDMLTIETGHFDYWNELAARGASALRAEGSTTAPIWSDYDEWPRGRVVYDLCASRFVVRADRKLHRPLFLQLITHRFHIGAGNFVVCADEHYLSARSVGPTKHIF